MTLTELKAAATELGFTFGFKQAMSGSQYITIEGKKFRIADHEQPSWYQIKNHVDVNSYQSIYNKITHPDFAKKEIQYTIEDGVKYMVEYDDRADEFILTKVD